MGTSYPGGLDTFTNPSGTDGLNLPDHADQHADANDAIAAIQAELGTNPSGVYDTVAARFAAIGGGGGGGGGVGGLELIDSGTFTAATSGSPAALPGGSFDAGYDYLLDVRITNPSAGDALRGRFVVTGSGPETGAVYAASQHYILIPIAHGAQAWSGQTSMLWASTGRRRGRIKMEISGAADSDFTSWRSDYSYMDTATAGESGYYGGGVDSSTSYDAFQWWPDTAASVSGDWRLYRWPV